MHEVNEFIMDKLERKGAIIDGYFACPFVDSKYAEKARKKGRKINSDYLRNDYEDLKPNPGMVYKAVENAEAGIFPEDIYVFGDRKSDIELGLGVGGKGILIPSKKTLEEKDIEKVEILRERNPGKVHIAENFFHAAEIIVDIYRDKNS